MRVSNKEFQATVNHRVRDTIVHEDLYVLALVEMIDYLEEWPTVVDVKEALKDSPRSFVATETGKEKVKGPVRIPIAIDGVWLYMKVYLSENPKYKDSVQLAPTFMGVNVLRRLVKGTVTTELDNDFTIPTKFWPGEREEIPMDVLLDTGVAPNVITTGVWRRLGCPKLRKSQISLLVADQSKVGVLGRTDFISFNFIVGATMRARFYVIPSKGKDQAILGREFMRNYPISFNLLTDCNQ